MNSPFEEQTGFTAEQIIGRRIQDVFDSETAEELIQNYRRCIEVKKSISYTEEVDTPRGSGIWKTKLTPLIQDGRVHAIHGASRDIGTDIIQSRDLTLFREAMQKNPDEVYIIDPDTGRFLDVTDSVPDMLGYSREELMTMTMSEVDPEIGTEKTWEEQAEEIKSRGPVTFEVTHRRKDGSTFPVEVRADYVKLEDELPVIVATARDITALKKVENELRASEHHYRTLFEQANEAFLIESFDDEVLEANQAAGELLGYSREELVGMNLDELIPTDLQNSDTDEGIVRSRLNEHGTSLSRTVYLHSDSSKVPVANTKKPIQMKNGEAVLVCIRDRSELEQAKKESQMKSTFVSQVTHDLRTPLNSIQGMADLLGNTDLSIDQRNYLRTIVNAAQNMERLTGGILDLNRIERGELSLQERLFSPRKLLREILSQYETRLQKQGLTLGMSIVEQVPSRLIGDRDRLSQILHNLVDNAVKYTREGTIQINLDIQNETSTHALLEFTVSDSGSGIATEQLDTIFDEHQQAQSLVSEAPNEGVGLGLSICKEFVNLMEGEISVTSEEGEGTTFTFTVNTRKGEVPGNVNLEDTKVLVMDDNPHVRKIFRSYLEQHGMSVTEREGGEKVVAELKENREEQHYDVVFLDFRMEPLSGLEIIRQVSSNQGGIELDQFFVVSGEPCERVQEKLGDISIGGILEKPLNESELIQAVRSAVKPADFSGVKNVVQLMKEIQKMEGESMPLLVVEDDAQTRKLLQEFLDPLTEQISFAKTGEDGFLKRFDPQESPPEVILMDYELRELNGVELTKKIRREEASRGVSSVPIIAQTAMAMNHVEADFMEAGADRFLRKPFKRFELYQTIRDVLQEKQREKKRKE